MTRKEFIEKSLVMGIGLPFLSSTFLQSCSKDDSIFPKFQTNFSGKVIIVGAGAAGLAAGYLLKRYGVDFEIIEAASVYGGRLKKSSNFADFPIDIGAEWIHTDPKILADIINKPASNANIDIIVYNPQTIKSWKNGKLKSHNYISSFYSEWKFKNSTWFDFFEQFIVPEIADKIVLNKPITEINYQGDKVLLLTGNNETYEADKVLITTPIKTLQNEQIVFQPALPTDKKEAINKVFMGDGIKIFIEFKEKFYPDILAFGNIFQALNEEEKFVYDAAFRKDSNKHILGLFAINDKANAYTQLNSEQEIIDKFMAELDEIFEGKATANYVNHIIQNWSKEPYIQGAYSYSFDGKQEDIVATINDPLLDKVYFAGEALSIKNQAMVHGACESAYSMIATMMKDE
jgi:monoamine oxidase